MRNRHYEYGLVALIILATSAWAANTADTIKLDGKQVKLAHYAKAYIGEGNVKLEIAPYKLSNGEEGGILVLHGVEGDWDGKAVNHLKHDEGYQNYTYAAKYNGKEWNTFQIRQTSGEPKYSLFPPGTRDEIDMVPSDGAAQLTTPMAIYDEYVKQKSGK